MTGAPRASGPLAAWRALVAEGAFAPDAAQRRAADALDRLHARLRARSGRGGAARRFADRIADRIADRVGLAPRPDPSRSLWLHGEVGRGKTALMDQFHACAGALPGVAARRVHFHAFMTDAHARIHDWRTRERARGFPDGADPVPPLAAALAAEAGLLCFDEFEVRDVADAAVLGRLFAALLERGVIVVATSNRAPRDLYPGGLRRDLILPFVALVDERFDVLHLNGETDWRLRGLRRMPVYFTPLGDAAERALDDAFVRLAGGAQAVAETLRVGGRDLAVPAANGGIARFGFGDLCARPLGAADYLAVAARFHTVFVSGVPAMAPEKRNEARRFAHLVDILYDRRVKLVASADAAPEALYPRGDGAFEFRRTASRLVEMQTPAYLALPHGCAGNG